MARRPRVEFEGAIYHVTARIVGERMGRGIEGHRRHGHLFQGRYAAKPVEGDHYVLSLSRYIHLNPVRIKKVKEWPLDTQLRHLHLYHWSSYRAYMSTDKDAGLAGAGACPGAVWAHAQGAAPRIHAVRGE